MKTELLTAILDHGYWMERFTRVDYFKAFRAFIEKYGPVYMEAVREAGDDAGLAALAKELLDEVAAECGKVRIWNRFTARFNAKQMLISYVSPMLLGLEEPGCKRLAEALRDDWAARWPKEAYQLADYKMIRSGFRNVIMGIEIKDNLRELEDAIEEREKNQK